MNLFEINYTIETESIKNQIKIVEDSKIYFKDDKGQEIGIPKWNMNYNNLKDDYFKHKSLFPNNCLHNPAVNSDEQYATRLEEFITLINDADSNERNVLNFINRNRYYFIVTSILRDYSFGNHGAYLFKEFPLGTSYRADYVVLGRSSGGMRIIFVEFENIYSKITLNDGSFGETIRKGLRQIEKWKTWIEQNYNMLKEAFSRVRGRYESFPEELLNYDSTRIHYMVIAGRRSDYKENTYILRRRLEPSRVKVWHYDNLIDAYKSLISTKAY